MKNRDKIYCLLTGVAFGAAIWILSPLLINEIEPWDGDTIIANLYLPVFHILAGFLLGAIWKCVTPFGSVGIFIGEVLFLLLVRSGPLVLIGILYLFFYVLLAMLLEFFIGISCKKGWKVLIDHNR